MDTIPNHEILPMFELWMKGSSRSDSTITLRMRYLQQLATQIELTTAKPHQIETALAATRTLSANTRHSILSSWRLFYRWATERHLIEENPTRLIEPIIVRTRIPRVATDEAIITGLQNATPRDRALILLGRCGCLRLTEITTLHMRARTGDTLTITGKGDKQRIIYLNTQLLDALEQLEALQPFGYYFPGKTGNHLHPQSVSKIIRRRTAYNTHALRHAGASAAYRGTKDLRAVQITLGHESLATTQKYIHINDDALRAAADATTIDTGNRLVA